MIKSHKIQFWIIFSFSALLYRNSVYASGLVPDRGRYKLILSSNILSKKSKSERDARTENYIHLSQNLLKLEELERKTESPVFKEELKKAIKEHKRLIELSESYIDDSYSSASIEYGFGNNQSGGVQALYKRNKYCGKSSRSNYAEFFYKNVIYQNGKHEILIQPQVNVSTGHNFNESFGELSLSYNGELINRVFFGIGGGFTKGLRKNCKDKSHYTVVINEGLRLDHGILLLHYSKYHKRKNCAPAYENTLYEQFSVAKEFIFVTMPQNKLTLQVGYFWDGSLKYKKIKVSGVNFSLWLEV